MLRRFSAPRFSYLADDPKYASEELVPIRIEEGKFRGTVFSFTRVVPHREPDGRMFLSWEWRLVESRKSRDALDASKAFRRTQFAILAELLAEESAQEPEDKTKVVEVDGNDRPEEPGPQP